MTNNDMYLKSIIDKYAPISSSSYTHPLFKLKEELRSWAAASYVAILDSGSNAKGTAISLSSDIDILVSLKSGCYENKGGLKGIYNCLYELLNGKYKNTRKQNVSVRVVLPTLTLLGHDYKVDVTPARLQLGSKVDHSLYLAKTGTWTKTNIQRHINDIKNSGRANEIRLLKIWRELNRLEFTSIYLEYLVLNVLTGKPFGLDHLSTNFLFMLNGIAKDTVNPLFWKIIDPANSSNILSDTLANTEKLQIKNAAKLAMKKTHWSNIIY
jgi:predicted nucleotidyltransferase